MDLQAIFGDDPCPNAASDCANATLELGSSLALVGRNICTPGGPFSMCTQFIPTMIPVQFRHADVPEPSTLALFAIALGSLGFMMRRRLA